MLVGKSYHSLDTQRRVPVHKHMRGDLGSQPMITRGLDGGLFLLPESFWQGLMNTLEHQPFTQKRARDFMRLLSNDAYPVSADALGRITIPGDLANAFGLTKDVVVVGSLQYIEIWDRERYNTHFDEVAKSAEDIAETLNWKNDNARASHEN